MSMNSIKKIKIRLQELNAGSSLRNSLYLLPKLTVEPYGLETPPVFKVRDLHLELREVTGDMN